MERGSQLEKKGNGQCKVKTAVDGREKGKQKENEMIVMIGRNDYERSER